MQPIGQSNYTIRDAVYEAIALHLEQDLTPFRGTEKFVLQLLCLPKNDKRKVAFPDMQKQLPRFTLLVRKAQESATVKAHILAVLWSLLPLNLDLGPTHNKNR